MSRFGTLLLIVRRSLAQHAVSTSVTVGATALACGLVMAVFSVSAQTRSAFMGGPVGFDAVLGARGSPLQLVLNAVFHLETSPGNIPWSMYTQLAQDERVELAVPYAVGDSYQGFRVVGTTAELFTRWEPLPNEPVAFAPGGRPFDESRREAVLGATVADITGLGVGSVFQPAHGLAEAGGHDHDEEYLVVGVLEPLGSPVDRVVWIPIDGVFRMSGHVLRGTGKVYEAQPGQAIADEHKEVSAVLVRFHGTPAGFYFNDLYNRQGKEATLAFPIAASLAELFNKMGWVTRVLELVAFLVVLVATGAILASIYNTMNERRGEFAILRALGAQRRTVFSAIVLEAGSIAVLGALGGYAVHVGLLSLAGWVVRAQTGVVLDLWQGHPALAWTPVAMVGLGALAGLVPAFKAYSTDVADNL